MLDDFLWSSDLQIYFTLKTYVCRLPCSIRKTNFIQLTVTNHSLSSVPWFTPAHLFWVHTVINRHAISIVVTHYSLTRAIT